MLLAFTASIPLIFFSYTTTAGIIIVILVCILALASVILAIVGQSYRVDKTKVHLIAQIIALILTVVMCFVMLHVYTGKNAKSNGDEKTVTFPTASVNETSTLPGNNENNYYYYYYPDDYSK